MFKSHEKYKYFLITLDTILNTTSSLLNILYLTNAWDQKLLAEYALMITVASMYGQTIFSSLTVCSQIHAKSIFKPNIDCKLASAISTFNIGASSLLLLVSIFLYLINYKLGTILFSSTLLSIGLAQKLSLNSILISSGNIKELLRYNTIYWLIYFSIVLLTKPFSLLGFSAISIVCSLSSVILIRGFPNFYMSSFYNFRKLNLKSVHLYFKQVDISYLHWSLLAWLRQNINIVSINYCFGATLTANYFILNTYTYNLSITGLSIIRVIANKKIYENSTIILNNVHKIGNKFVFALIFIPLCSLLSYIISTLFVRVLSNSIYLNTLPVTKVLLEYKNLIPILFVSGIIFTAGEILLDGYQSSKRWKLLSKIKIILNVFFPMFFVVLILKYSINGAVYGVFVYALANFWSLLFFL